MPSILTGFRNKIENNIVLIPTGSTFDDLTRILKTGGYITDEAAFRRVASMKKYTTKIRTGRYELKPGWNNNELIDHLRAGKQAPVKVVLTNQRLLENVAEKVSRFLESDSASLIRVFSDRALSWHSGTWLRKTLMSVFIPNTYEMYWNTTPEAFVDRMIGTMLFGPKTTVWKKQRPWT